ncbi:MAG TPA: MBL fold metallo-hydrolase [Caulobacteraceae bacterium]|jgi:glyoxylase-like metal-dependent hydrolase (beta-lactamase superfamily II)
MQSIVGRRLAGALAAAGVVCVAVPANSVPVETVPLSAPWRAGAPDCKASPEPPLEIRAYGPATYALRENPCVTWEAPFMYLLIGKSRALMIDTGDVADPAKAPLAATVLALLPGQAGQRLPLLVVHTHRHLDHRAGDVQFAGQANVQAVGYDLASVQRFYGFQDWPKGRARIDLGERIVDVIPAPGHNATHVVFYDEQTSLLFSGDFLMPGRLLIDDAAADRASAARVAAFLRDRPVGAVLGGHIELRADGHTEPWQSQWHPQEHALPIAKDELMALPGALDRFNGVYTRTGPFLMMDSGRILAIAAAMAATVLIAALGGVVMLVRRWRGSARHDRRGGEFKGDNVVSRQG